MRQVHQGRGITMHHFTLVAGHLTDTPHAGPVCPKLLSARSSGAVAPLVDEIATARPA
jgi:hemoglobin